MSEDILKLLHPLEIEILKLHYPKVCALDVNTLLQICTVFPKLRDEIMDVARLWDRYERYVGQGV